MNLDRETHDAIIELLTPLFGTPANRRALLKQAFFGKAILNHLNYSGPAHVFTVNLVGELVFFGEIEPGKPALAALLETAKGQVGVNKQRQLDALIGSIPSQAAPTNPGGTAANPTNDEEGNVSDKRDVEVKGGGIAAGGDINNNQGTMIGRDSLQFNLGNGNSTNLVILAIVAVIVVFGLIVLVTLSRDNDAGGGTIIDPTPTPTETPSIELLTDTEEAPDDTSIPANTPTPPPPTSTSSLNFLLFPDRDMLTLYLPEQGTVSVSGLALAVTTGGAEERHTLDSYPSFAGLPFGQLDTPACFELARSNGDTPRVMECQAVSQNQVFRQSLSDADMFWDDAGASSTRLINIYQDGAVLGRCPAGASRCAIGEP